MGRGGEVDECAECAAGPPGEQARFVREWISPVSAPIAVRLRIARRREAGYSEQVDTLLVLVGPRG